MYQRHLEASELGSLPPCEILRRSLRLATIVSTESSFAQKSRRAYYRSELQEINQIGIGLQGVVFEQVGKAPVFKKEEPGNESRPSNLAHEYELHVAISAAFKRYQTSTRTEVIVPEPVQFLLAESPFWNDTLSKIPLEYRTRGNAIMMERILPLPKVVRRALIDFCLAKPTSIDPNCSKPESESARLLDSPQNKHSLARVYLGKGTGPYTHEAPLRNFPLHLNIMKELDLDIYELANQMGKAYASLHWGSGVNADDVEFVLGTILEAHEESSEDSALQHTSIGLFLLDFGQCERVDLTQDPESVYQAFKGAMVLGDNQSFIPHASTDPELYYAFKDGYVKAGNIILSDKKLNHLFSIEDFMREYEDYAEDFLY